MDIKDSIVIPERFRGLIFGVFEEASSQKISITIRDDTGNFGVFKWDKKTITTHTTKAKTNRTINDRSQLKRDDNREVLVKIL